MRFEEPASKAEGDSAAGFFRAVRSAGKEGDDLVAVGNGRVGEHEEGNPPALRHSPKTGMKDEWEESGFSRANSPLSPRRFASLIFVSVSDIGEETMGPGTPSFRLWP